MASCSGTVSFSQLSDADVIKLYSFKEKHKIHFQLVAPASNNNTALPSVNMTWSNIEGLEQILELAKELQQQKAIQPL